MLFKNGGYSGITFELSGVKLRSSFMSGGGAQRRNELERFVISGFQTAFQNCRDLVGVLIAAVVELSIIIGMS